MFIEPDILVSSIYMLAAPDGEQDRGQFSSVICDGKECNVIPSPPSLKQSSFDHFCFLQLKEPSKVARTTFVRVINATYVEFPMVRSLSLSLSLHGD